MSTPTPEGSAGEERAPYGTGPAASAPAPIRKVRTHHLLRRLAQLDRGDAPLRSGDAALALQQPGDPADLVGGQRVEGMGMGHGIASCSARRSQC